MVEHPEINYQGLWEFEFTTIGLGVHACLPLRPCFFCRNPNLEDKNHE